MSMQFTAVRPTQRTQSSVTCSPAFTGAMSGESAWNREARAVLILADRLETILDEEELALYDMRNLQALRLTLQCRLAQ
jgi:hypothetical protein